MLKVGYKFELNRMYNQGTKDEIEQVGYNALFTAVTDLKEYMGKTIYYQSKKMETRRRIMEKFFKRDK